MRQCVIRFFRLIFLSGGFFLFLVPGLTSCSFYRTYDEFSLVWPESGVDYWNLTWLSSEGIVFHRRVEGSFSPVISIARGIPLLITAVPQMKDAPALFQIKPAGFVSASCQPRSSILELSWEEGFSADFLLKLVQSGISPEIVNIEKFADSVISRSNGNPWNLDIRKLSSEFLESEIRVYSFRLLPIFPVSIPLPTGRWLSEYPPEGDIISESDLWEGELCIGLHGFMRPDDGMVIIVSVDERGDVILYSGSCQFTFGMPRLSSH